MRHPLKSGELARTAPPDAHDAQGWHVCHRVGSSQPNRSEMTTNFSILELIDCGLCRRSAARTSDPPAQNPATGMMVVEALSSAQLS
jgi:hypothetical protein